MLIIIMGVGGDNDTDDDTDDDETFLWIGRGQLLKMRE